ncbi:hypothetical protein F4810DRAFT_715990 [Camillea tinctor]|nr:hypothetical protein F4810DRAFT_715990 [Camillea tinctor]
MKLAIGGSSGFVGTELIRQALDNPAIDSIVGISRRETSVPVGSEDKAWKLKSIVCDDFENYPDSLKKELEDVDACIWTIAVTPSKMKSTPWEEVVKICRDYTLTALETMASVPRKQDGPLRFVYISGHFAPRDGAPIPKQLTEFGLVQVGSMRIFFLKGRLEAHILDYSEKSNGAVASCIAKPGMIKGPGMEVRIVPGLPEIELHDIATTLLDQVVNGFEKDTLSNDDMVRIAESLRS